MLWLARRHPEEPPTWRADVREAEARAAKWARGAPVGASEDEVFEPLWSRHKRAFSRVQYGKCAYCEMPIAADPSDGDIEHYRPKARVTKLGDDPATWGDELDHSNRVHPRRPRRTEPACPGKGYWWLAYEWTNYLLSCGTCNQKWKGSLFPIEGGHRRAPTRESCAKERPLILNPYGEADPALHLEFDTIGQVAPRERSVIGFETIRTCHLTRETLRAHRQPVARDARLQVWRVVEELTREPRREQRLLRALGDLLRQGDPGRDHAGMVRAIWAHEGVRGVRWRDLRRLRRDLRQARRRAL